MNEEEKKKPIDILHDHLTEGGWTDLKKENGRLFVNQETPLIILEEKGNENTLHFVWRIARTGAYGISSGLETITFSDDADFSRLVYLRSTGYKLSFDAQIKGILQLGAQAAYKGTTALNISSKNKKLSHQPKEKMLKIPYKKYLEILEDAEKAYKKSASYGTSVLRYLINQYSKKHLNKDTKLTTTIEKGEFEFLVHRLNLETKKKKTDYEKYLGKKDISSLQQLVLDLVQKEVFEPDFLRELDEYFIRERLKEIIALGREILDLKSADLKTDKAKEIISKIGDGKQIKQLETLWQKFFEKYLLYLIFSYKEIYPKVQLEDLETDKKFPDFIGINHYNGVDVIEIKTHLTPAVVYDKSHKNFSFSSETSKAIIQTVNYLDAIKQQKFKDGAQRDKITETTHEENLYRPRGIIVISSWDKLAKNNKKEKKIIERDFTKLRSSLHSIELLTFDEILNIADNYCEKIVKTKKK